MPCKQHTTPDAAVQMQDQDIRSRKGRYWRSVDCRAKTDAQDVFDVMWIPVTKITLVEKKCMQDFDISTISTFSTD